MLLDRGGTSCRAMFSVVAHGAALWEEGLFKGGLGGILDKVVWYGMRVKGL